MRPGSMHLPTYVDGPGGDGRGVRKDMICLDLHNYINPCKNNSPPLGGESFALLRL
jgi:hypothetical protein